MTFFLKIWLDGDFRSCNHIYTNNKLTINIAPFGKKMIAIAWLRKQEHLIIKEDDVFLKMSLDGDLSHVGNCKSMKGQCLISSFRHSFQTHCHVIRSRYISHRLDEWSREEGWDANKTQARVRWQKACFHQLEIAKYPANLTIPIANYPVYYRLQLSN